MIAVRSASRIKPVLDELKTNIAECFERASIARLFLWARMKTKVGKIQECISIVPRDAAAHHHSISLLCLQSWMMHV